MRQAGASTGAAGGEDGNRSTRGAHPRRSRSRGLLDWVTKRVSEPIREYVTERITVDLAVAVAIAVRGTDDVHLRNLRVLTDLTRGLDLRPSLRAVGWQGIAGKR